MSILTDLFKKKSAQVVIPKRRNMTHLNASTIAPTLNFASSRGLFSSPNLDLLQNLQRTRDLSRYLVEIDPFLQRYIEVISVYVTGQEGLSIEPNITDSRGRLAERTNSSIKAAWYEWANEASYDTTMSFPEIEQLVVRSVARDGEAIVRMITGADVNKYGFALQPIDPQNLDITYNSVLPGERVVIMGIEFDKRGRPVAYYIWNRLATDINMTPRIRERIPAEEIIHIFDTDIPGAVRGMPWTTSVLNTVSRLNQFLEVHLQACSIAASTPLVMTNEQPDVVGVDDVAVNGQPNARPVQPQINLAYSQILELDHGKSLQALNLNFPTQAFEQATRQYLQSIAAGLFMSYATLSADPNSGNSANIRFSSIVEKEHYAQLQRWIIKTFHMKVYKNWIENAILQGAIRLPTMNAEDYFNVNFRNTRHSTIDPTKDMRGYIEGIDNGLYTRSQIVAEMGGNFEENVKKLAEEKALLEQYGVTLGSIPAQPQPVIEAEVVTE